MSKKDYDPEYLEQEEKKAAPYNDCGSGETPHKMGPAKYLATRLTTLKPPMAKVANPVSLLRTLSRQQWAFFGIAFCAWTWDAFDFFTVSLVVGDLAKTFGKTNADITWGITLVLMFRSVGAILFGIASDRYGRKWPFVVNNLLFIVLELGTGFCNTYDQFLAVRALFGIAMGGLYGNVAATALEDCPPDARGIISGMLQQGYAMGYLLATVFARALVNTTSHGWRPFFWFGACPPILLIVWRMFLPETQAFQQRQRVRESGSDVGSTFIREGKVALRRHWLLLIFMVLFMAGMNFMSHGSQDLYPTLLKNQLNFSANKVTVTQVIANLGAMTGGTVVGYSSQIFGRRLSIMAMCILGGALLYPYTFVKNDSIMAGAFFEQFAVQGAWGCAPVYLMELSPGSFRTFVVGTSYQLGNLVSSASSTIEATISERFPLPPKGTTKRFEYGKVICIFMAAVFAYTFVMIFLGPEYRGRDMSVENDSDMEEAAGRQAVAGALGKGDRKRTGSAGTDDIDRV